MNKKTPQKGQSALKTVRKKSRKMKSAVVKTKVPKGLKRLVIHTPGYIRETVDHTVWEQPTPLSELNIGDEIITACGWNGYIDEIGYSPTFGLDFVSLKDKHGNGHRTVLAKAVYRIGDGKNDENYIFEANARKNRTRQATAASAEGDETDWKENE